MRRISFGVLATLFLVPVTRAGDESPVRGADLGTHVAGPAVTAVPTRATGVATSGPRRAGAGRRCLSRRSGS